MFNSLFLGEKFIAVKESAGADKGPPGEQKNGINSEYPTLSGDIENGQ